MLGPCAARGGGAGPGWRGRQAGPLWASSRQAQTEAGCPIKKQEKSREARMRPPAGTEITIPAAGLQHAHNIPEAGSHTQKGSKRTGKRRPQDRGGVLHRKKNK